MTDQIANISAALDVIDREIWIVTAANDDRRGGLVATWVSEASIDRQTPTLLAGIAPNHFTAELIDASGAFAAHLISRDQIEMTWGFAIGSGRDRDKLADVPHRAGVTGSPILNDCVAFFECRVFSQFDAGDRIYYWADIEDAAKIGEDTPVRQSDLFRAASQQQMHKLAANRDADILIQRPMYQQWRASLK